MTDGVGHVRAQGIGLGQVFAVELLALQIAERLAAVQLGLQQLAGAAGGTSVWREPEVSPESGAIQVLLRS